MNGGRTVFVPEPPHDTLPYDLPWSAPSVRAVKIGLLLAMWYSTSVITSLTTKTILSHFPFPITLALAQQAVAALLSYISWRWERADAPPAASRDRANIVMPIAAVMVLSLVRRTAPHTALSAAQRSARSTATSNDEWRTRATPPAAPPALHRPRCTARLHCPPAPPACTARAPPARNSSLRASAGAALAALRRQWCGAASRPRAAAPLHHQVSYRWSMLSVSVSFTHTIKTLGPMFTIFFSRLLLAEHMPISRLLSVLPVVLGVAITTSTEVEFALVPPTRAQHTSGLHALHRSPQPAARSPQPAARSPQPAARSPQPAARSPQPAARSPQPAARSPAPQPRPSAPPLSPARGPTLCRSASAAR